MSEYLEASIVIPPHKGGFSLTHNEHLNSYETVAAAIELAPDYFRENAFVSAEDRQRCIDTNEMWVAHWYPATPVAFCYLCASSLEFLNMVLRVRLSAPRQTPGRLDNPPKPA